MKTHHTKVWLGIYAFAAGFVLMVYEMAAARILAPSIGSSMYIWTSVIGVIVMALSAGYWYGGRLADARHRITDVALLFWLLAALIVLTLVLDLSLLGVLEPAAIDSRLKAVIASVVLFAPASFVAGMISPYLAKLNITELKTSGQAIADLGALNSIGGIVGTFLAGFVLFGYVGVREVIITLAIISLAMSWTIDPRWERQRRMIWTGVLVIASLLLLGSATPVQSIDTPSAHYQLVRVDRGDSEELHLTTGPGASQSGITLGKPDELIFWYNKEFLRILEENPPAADSRMLVLGGGAYTLPRYLAATYPDAQIDVVEIDPELIKIARDHFAYDDPSNVTSYPTDARVFTNSTDNTYDFIFVDVFSHDQTPFTFVTREYGEALGRISRPGAVVMINIIGGREGSCKQLTDAILAPYEQNYERGGMIYRNSLDQFGNIVAVFGGSELRLPSGFSELGADNRTLFSDNLAPTERLSSSCFNSTL